ncbi:pyridoxamine 5'-phosphate oxidase [Leptospira sp. 2 VSF19]|uniref:Pyridoxine/pyridoxamine 5'-phosphate oxidase n=1 Tax=Leptospira soteropolitanensis TaxID=2950025 RepID=A0AAW5VH64_9LEPT|nr:pyridoxamine 5'-phosphate oxidase [Leptospira soteropolitanensis]MCW7492850.1 pyridoxamine 5'-phosphate oxidase [Leptospira soteropolitanensis]MCW7500085.1 pyridoxamine 5'-phosphate oxidase [Leptospira soteropolitanensis]MCW7522336.1 pyridoxamine 5'-phosphate oxidase [Leptospira soteropolitanensis]MCW7526192.1 pyridoxamine 5'-phosphate oxidase [Leptospira soteropolitanensis]MCW7529696.1 pyridoxamine 5'-phosphate oxidase [Leptospira soteropolitanensis]
MNELPHMRKLYTRSVLSEETAGSDPLKLFSLWFSEAKEEGEPEPNAMSLATVDKTGQPSVRIVLLKGLIRDEFQFFTNYDSDKGRDIAENHLVALGFFWPKLERQIRIEGRAKRISKEESESYFAIRPRESQIGALTSNQSSVVPSREFLEEKFASLTKEWEGKEIPKPENWGGYSVFPTKIEFWQGRVGRLHDRISFERFESGWKRSRLSP